MKYYQVRDTTSGETDYAVSEEQLEKGIDLTDFDDKTFQIIQEIDEATFYAIVNPQDDIY
jgi:hypothetical protein